MTGAAATRVALLFPGDRAARDRADPAASRFAALFAALAAAGVEAEPAVYHDDFADEVTAQLLGMRVVLVWCNPIEDGRRRDRLDGLLREVARTGVIVSAHPDAILRLGTKDVLFETRELPFGSDVAEVSTTTAMLAACDAPVGGSVTRDLATQHLGGGAAFDLPALWRSLGVALTGEGRVVTDDRAPLAAVRRAIVAGRAPPPPITPPAMPPPGQ